MFHRSLLRLVTLALTCHAAPSSIDSKILIFADSAAKAASASSGLEAYGIPFDARVVPSEGIALPSLSSSATEGNYGGIVVVDSVLYEYEGGVWRSAITDEQWAEIHAYQRDFHVRMVRLGDAPSSASGMYRDLKSVSSKLIGERYTRRR